MELDRTTNDLTNLLTSTGIPVVMVGPDRRVRRFTAGMAALGVCGQAPVGQRWEDGAPTEQVPPGDERPELPE